ncbi:MAG TPA: hypothetical protein VGD41_05920 [Pyrinomonadaceae bacterium]
MKFIIIGAIWFVAAIALGASGVLARLRPPAPQVVLLALTIALLVAWRAGDSFRRWVEGSDLRALIAIHLTRFVGLYFLFLCGRGELPCSFAKPAGFGDILVATLALGLLLGWKTISSSRGLIAAWNALGLIDILFVVASAARHAMAKPGSMAAMLQLPLSLLITFLVPLIIASHIVIFGRLFSFQWSTRKGAAPSS